VTDVKMLRDKIDRSGYKIQFLAEKLGLSPQGFYLKLNGTNQFKADEIQALCQTLTITDPNEMKAIFFATEVDK
jgi:hypothetical protein